MFCSFKSWKDLHPASLCQLCATAMAYAVELMARGVIWMSAHWPSSLFVLAVTFSLCLCQNYPLCWVLALVSQGRVTLRHLLAGWHQVWCVKYWNKPQRDLDARREASLQLLCPFALPFWSLKSSEEQSLTFAFHFIQGKWSLTVHSYYLFIISHLSSCYPGFLQWFICINVFKHCKQWFSS